MIDELEKELRRTETAFRWYGSELVIDTSSGEVAFRFDLAGRLVSVEGSGSPRARVRLRALQGFRFYQAIKSRVRSRQFVHDPFCDMDEDCTCR